MPKNGGNKTNKKLTIKQQSFVDQYLIWSGNGVQAYIHSEYSTKDYGAAQTEAYKLLLKPEIQAEIARRRQKSLKKFTWDYNEILKEDIAIATVDPTLALELRQGCLIPPNELPEKVRKAISGVDVIESYAKGGDKIIKYKYRFWDKGNAIDRFTKRTGGYEADNRQKQIDIEGVVKTILDVIKSLPGPDATRIMAGIEGKIGLITEKAD